MLYLCITLTLDCFSILTIKYRMDVIDFGSAQLKLQCELTNINNGQTVYYTYFLLTWFSLYFCLQYKKYFNLLITTQQHRITKTKLL